MQPLHDVAEAAERLEAARAGLAAAVREARADGASWADVGARLGISRQAAFKRFGAPRDPRTGGTMTTRPTDHVPALVAQVFRDIDAGDYRAVQARMPQDVAAQLTEDVVLGTWSRVVGEIGNLEDCTGTTVEHVPGHVSERVSGHAPDDQRAFGVVVGDTTLQCEAGELRGRIALDDQDRVVGILVVAPDATDLPF